VLNQRGAQHRKRLGIGRTMLYHLMGTGHLRAVHIGRLTRFTADELDRFVKTLQADGALAEGRSQSA
jgi:excisionase family DNA binding protein